MNWAVYEHISPSGKVYVGITSNINNRWANKGYYYQLKDTVFARAIRKYGWDNFTHNILYTGLTLEEAAAKEIELISIQKKLNNSYNIADGGQGYKGKHSKEHIEKIVNSRISNNNTKILVIDKNFNYIEFKSKAEVDRYLNVSKGVTGHILKQPIGYTCKGYYLVELPKEDEVDINLIKESIYCALRSRNHIHPIKEVRTTPYKHSTETRAKMSRAAKGRDMTKARLARIRNANYTNTFRRKIIQYDLNDNVINEFSSITEATNFLNKTSRSIQNCLAGRTKTAFGYKWKYKDGGNSLECK